MANKTVPTTICLKGRPMIQEGIGSEAITPGNLLDFVLTGTGAGQVENIDSEGSRGNAMFAIENSQYGKGIDDDYPDGDTVVFGYFIRGDVVFARLEASAGAIVKGDALTADGTVAGVLKKAGATDDAVGFSEDALADNTSIQRIRVRIA